MSLSYAFYPFQMCKSVITSSCQDNNNNNNTLWKETFLSVKNQEPLFIFHPHKFNFTLVYYILMDKNLISTHWTFILM